MFEITNLIQMLNVLGNELWLWQWWWYKTSAQTDPFHQTVTKYAFQG